MAVTVLGGSQLDRLQDRTVEDIARRAAHTLSALRYPMGTDVSLVARIAEQGVYVAGGLHPTIRAEYFRVGHMGYALTRTDFLMRCVEAVALGLLSFGLPVDREAAVAAMLAELQSPGG